MQEKYEKLKSILASYESLLIGYSGGVDSSFLLKVATDVLGKNALGVTVLTPYIANFELNDAKRVAKEIKAKHIIIKLPWPKNVKSNPENRCYICKQNIFSTLKEFAREKNILMVAEGSNVDDTKEHRPGRAAIMELGIKTPLLEALLTKDDIRKLSLELGISTWNKPSFPCLLTRFPYNFNVTKKALQMVSEAEKLLIMHDYKSIRVRFDNNNARIEMSYDDSKRFLEDLNLDNILSQIKNLDFLHVSLDVEKIAKTKKM